MMVGWILADENTSLSFSVQVACSMSPLCDIRLLKREHHRGDLSMNTLVCFNLIHQVTFTKLVATRWSAVRVEFISTPQLLAVLILLVLDFVRWECVLPKTRLLVFTARKKGAKCLDLQRQLVFKVCDSVYNNNSWKNLTWGSFCNNLILKKAAVITSWCTYVSWHVHHEVKLTGAGNTLTKGCLTSGLRRDVLLYIPPCSSLSPPAFLFHNHLISLPSAAALAAEQMHSLLPTAVYMAHWEWQRYSTFMINSVIVMMCWVVVSPCCRAC